VGRDVEDVPHRKPHVLRAPASKPWGKEMTNETDLGEVAQRVCKGCATSSRSGRGVMQEPHGILASSDDMGFPMFDLFEVCLLVFRVELTPNS